ncbi:MAG TPA: glycosyltransferase [Actinomycetales bacterium]|nr:glycosyltransferase [Actinomycetales bacterium]
MKVLTVIDSLRLGGAENVLVTLARAAASADLQLQVLSLGPSTGPQAQLSPLLEAEGMRPRFLSLRRLADPTAVPRIARAIRASGCDVVHAHLEHAATLVPPASALARRPAVSTFHQLAGQLQGREAVKERLAIAAANRGRSVVFVSSACLESFAERYRRHGRWVVLPNAVDLDQYTPTPATMPANLAIPHGVPTVAVVAALRPAKDHETALRAWPAVLARVPSARLVVVGAGPTLPELERLAAREGIADRVVFAGLRTDVTTILRASTLAALPTTTEALPTALIEAAACGRAAVASDVGGVREVLVNGETGLLVPPRDPGALAQAIRALLLDEPTRTRMGRRARERAECMFGMTRWAKELRALYENAGASG